MYRRLLEIGGERKALGGRYSTSSANCFSATSPCGTSSWSHSDGDRPEVRAKLNQVVDTPWIGQAP